MKKLFLSIILALIGFSVTAQKTITGVVNDNSGIPLPGATVLVDGTNQGVTSDFDGNFSIIVSQGDILVASYVGYSDQKITVGSQDQYSFILSPDNELEEIVVTALGSVKEDRAVGYSIQKVDGSTLSNANEANIVNALQGQIAGVQIQGSPSALGGSSRITIRGSNSFLGNNQPLFVVDGVPIDNRNFADSGQARGFGGGSYDYGNMAADIDPNNIESMNVLKGAAATALYGSRGANGVILIQTKSGRGGKKGLGVTVNSSISFDDVNNLIPIQQEYGGGSINSGTTHGFSELIQDGTTYLYPNYAKDGSWGPKFNPNTLVRHWDSWDPNAANYKETRPWVAPENGYETFFETGTSINNSVSLTGSNDEGAFRMGYTNLDQTGTFPNAQLKRNTVNLNSSYNLTDKFTASLTMNYVNTTAENRNPTGYDNSNAMQGFTQWWQSQLDLDRLRNNQDNSLGQQYTWNPIGPVVDTDTRQFISWNNNPRFFDNPFWVRENFLQGDVRNRLFGNANLSYKINDDLSVTSQFSTDWYQFSLIEGTPIRSVDLARYSETERRFQETNNDIRLNYNKDINDNFQVTALVGANRMKQFSRRSSMNSSGGLVIDDFFNIDNSKESPTVSTFESAKSINSVYGSVNFGYQDMLFLDLSARNDWSSTLPEENNSYFYPAASVSFAFSELLKDKKVINFGKLRLSVAQAGNDADPYRLNDVFENTTPLFGSNPLYRVPQSRQNPNLVNELTTETEVGFNLRMFNNRLFIDAAYYDRTTDDQIFNVQSPSPTGYTSRLLNAGSMRNWGWELQASGKVIQKQDFTWSVGLNLTQINNEVLELLKDENGESVVENINMGGTWAAELRIQEDLPYMSIFGQDYVYHENGQRIVGENGAYEFTPDRVFLGSAIADYTGGFSTQFDYKGFSLSALFDFQVGGSLHSTSLQWSKYSGMHPETIAYNGETDTRANGMVLEGVDANGNPNTTRIDPQTYYQTYWRRAAPNVYDASFLKFRELRLSYKIPRSLIQDIAVEDITLSLFGRNLAILASDVPYIDPQIVTSAGNIQGLENAQIPSTRTVGANLTLKF